MYNIHYIIMYDHYFRYLRSVKRTDITIVTEWLNSYVIYTVHYRCRYLNI